MKDLLFLTHRIPFPPNKGDKIRSFNLLKQLIRDYRVYLGAFIDDPADWHRVEEVKTLCAGVHFIDLNPRLAKLRSLKGFLQGEALSLAYYRSADMQNWVDRILQQTGLVRALVFSSAMAQYVNGSRYRHLHRVIDFVDVDSDKWLQYSCNKAWPMNWVYRREGQMLLRFDRSVAAEFDASFFVTPEEAALFRRLAPEVAQRVTHINNGVDIDFFVPAEYPKPYEPGEKVLVFTGAMDYWANVDAVCWFAREVFPRVLQAVPKACFYIVGARPATAVRQLSNLPGVHVVGTVRDIRPYLAHAQVAVAPLRIARGVQNKVLEAMAMGKPVLATRAAMDGIQLFPGLESLVADEAELLAIKAAALLTSGDEQELGKGGREWVTRHYSWSRNLKRIEALLETNPIISEEHCTAATIGDRSLVDEAASAAHMPVQASQKHA